MFQHFTANHPVKIVIGERQAGGVALQKRDLPLGLVGIHISNTATSGLQVIEAQIHSYRHHPCVQVRRQGVATLATAHIEQALARRQSKARHIDG